MIFQFLSTDIITVTILPLFVVTVREFCYKHCYRLTLNSNNVDNNKKTMITNQTTSITIKLGSQDV